MISRRRFIQSSSLISAASTMPAFAAFDRDARCNVPPPPEGVKACLYGLRGEAAFDLVRQRMAERGQCSAAAMDDLQLSWAGGQDQCWEGDSLQVHTRYTPARAGLDLTWLTELASLPSSDLRAFAQHDNAFSALPLAVEPATVLINRRKLPPTLEEATLTSLEAAGLRPIFVLSDWHDTGASSWALPLLAHYVDLTAGGGDGATMFLTPHAVDGLHALQHDFMRRVDLSIKPLNPGVDAYRRLLDPADAQAVALFGNPVILTALLAEHSQSDSLGDFEEVPLSRFLGYELPALPRMQCFQVGSKLGLGSTRELAKGLLNAIAGNVPELFDECDDLSCNAHRVSGSEYAFRHYASIAHLDYLSDGGFAARTLAMLQRNFAHHASDPIYAARRTAGDAYFAWSEYLDSQVLASHQT